MRRNSPLSYEGQQFTLLAFLQKARGQTVIVIPTKNTSC
jgi:hypothetical protein